MWNSDNTLSLLCLLLLWAEEQEYFGLCSHFLHSLLPDLKIYHMLYVSFSKVVDVSYEPGLSTPSTEQMDAEEHCPILNGVWGHVLCFRVSWTQMDSFVDIFCYFDNVFVWASLQVWLCEYRKGIVAVVVNTNQNSYWAASEWGSKALYWLVWNQMSCGCLLKLPLLVATSLGCIKTKDCEILSNGFFPSRTVSISRHSICLHKNERGEHTANSPWAPRILEKEK